MPPRVLFVCLGNICRSPAAEGIARARAAARGVEVEIDSCGTGAWHVGDPPDNRMRLATRSAGYDLSALRARQLTESDFSYFDLLLAMDRANLSEIEARRPEGGGAEARLFLPDGNNVPDPYYEGGFDAVIRLIEGGVDDLLDRLNLT